MTPVENELRNTMARLAKEMRKEIGWKISSNTAVMDADTSNFAMNFQMIVQGQMGKTFIVKNVEREKELPELQLRLLKRNMKQRKEGKIRRSSHVIVSFPLCL